MQRETEVISQPSTFAGQNLAVDTLGVAPSRQEIINRAVEAKRRKDHRLAKLLAHQVLCSQEHIGPQTK